MTHNSSECRHQIGRIESVRPRLQLIMISDSTHTHEAHDFSGQENYIKLCENAAQHEWRGANLATTNTHINTHIDRMCFACVDVCSVQLYIVLNIHVITIIPHSKRYT